MIAEGYILFMNVQSIDLFVGDFLYYKYWIYNIKNADQA